MTKAVAAATLALGWLAVCLVVGLHYLYVPNDHAIAYLKENGWVHFNGYFYGIGE